MNYPKTTEDKILNSLIQTEFPAMDGVYIKWVNSDGQGWMAYVQLEKALGWSHIIYINIQYRSQLRHNPDFLMEILRHELLHLETQMPEEYQEFRLTCFDRKIVRNSLEATIKTRRKIPLKNNYYIYFDTMLGEIYGVAK